MTIIDVLKIVPHNQNVIIDIYMNGHLIYCSVMDYVETAGEVLTKIDADKLGYTVTEISTKIWTDPITKKDIFSLVVASDN